MLPVLLDIGPITIYSFGFFLALSYLVGTFVFWKLGKKQGYNEEKLLDLSIISLIAALAGGHLYFVALNFGLFRDDLVSILYVWQGGFAYHGSLAVVFLVASYFVIKWKWSYFQIADIASLAATASLIIGKVGTFFAGFDFGRVSSLPWSVQFPSLVGQRHPVQLYEALAYTAVFVLLYYLYFRNLASSEMKSGKIFFSFLVLTGLTRAVFEFFRAQSLFVGRLPLASLVSLVVVSLAVVALYYFQIRDLKSDLRVFLGSFLVLNKKVLRGLKL